MRWLIFLLLWAGGCSTEAGSTAKQPVARGGESLLLLEQEAHRCGARAGRYEAAAVRAEREADAGAARLFRAMGYAERVQEQHIVRAIRQLGGRYRPPRRRVIQIRSTFLNFQGVLTELPPDAARAIDRALNEGNRYAARLIIRNAASENRMQRAVERFLAHPAEEEEHYFVCRRCGYLCEESFFDPYCPQCLQSGRLFKEF